MIVWCIGPIFLPQKQCTIKNYPVKSEKVVKKGKGRDGHIHLLNLKNRCGPLLFIEKALAILIGSVLIGLDVNIFLVPF